MTGQAYSKNSNTSRIASRSVYGQSSSNSHIALEVISGLNQGEQLKLDDSPVVIGGSEDCDLYLAEPNLSQANLIVERDGESVLVSRIKTSDCEAYTGTDRRKKIISEQCTLNINETFCLGGVWIKVFDTKLPAGQLKEDSPLPMSEHNSSASTLRTNTLSPKIDSQFDFKRPTNPHRTRHSLRALDNEETKRSPKWIWLKASSLVMSSLGICALTVSVAQGVHKPAEASDQMLLAEASIESKDLTQQEKALIAETILESQNAENHKRQTSENLFTKKKDLITPESKLPFLKTIFNQMLIDRELPQTVHLNYNDGRFFIQGTLEKSKHDILSRMISRFRLEHNLSQTFENEIKSSVSSLPFEIVQVTSGRYGNIVTDSGDRLFVGDQLSGFQLVAIQDHQLVFAGKSRVTVAW